MPGKYVLRKTIDGEFYFYLTVGNGLVILTSERYRGRAAAEDGVKAVRKNAPLEEHYECRTSSSAQSYFVLKAANRGILGRSEIYASVSACERGIASVRENAPSAEVDDQT